MGSLGSKQEGKKGAESDKADGKLETNGMADLLAVNINRISELYRAVDEQRAIKSESWAGQPIEATLKSGDMSEILENSANEKSQISLGPISVPMGSLTGLAGRLMKGPRISVALHKSRNEDNKDYLYLTATMSGKELCSWVVKDQMPLEGGNNPRNIDDMIAELAHRIFARLAFGDRGKLVHWRAVWSFNEGLRAYRDCLHSIKKRQYFLNLAEKLFIETVEEDDDFIQAYYNLGVVYTELHQLDSAEAAFSKAIEKKPDNWEPYYALGINLYNRAKDHEDNFKLFLGGLPESRKYIITDQYETAIKLCEYIINIIYKKGGLLDKDYFALALAYNLMGNAQGNLSMVDCKNCRPIFGDDNIDSGIFNNNQRDIFNKSIKSCESAANHSWCNLILAEFRGDRVDNANRIVSECLIDLAEMYLHKKLTYDAAKSIEQAIYLQPSNPILYLRLGKIYSLQERFDAAMKVFMFGVQMAPEDSRFWACLGYVQAKMKNRSDARKSWEKVILYGPGACSDALSFLAKALYDLGPIESNEIIRLQHASILSKLNGEEKKSDSITNSLPHRSRALLLRSWDEKDSILVMDLLEMISDNRDELGEGNEWKRAMSSIKLLDLYDLREDLENRQFKKIKLFETNIRRIIEDLKNIKGTKNGYEEAHNRYALGYLLFLYSHYGLELCLDAKEAFEAGKAKYDNKIVDKATKYIGDSIELLKNNPFLYKNNINKDLNEKKIDEHIEKAKEHFELMDLSVPITDLEEIFRIIYMGYKNDADDCFISTESIFLDELRTKSSELGSDPAIKDYANFLIELGQLYLKFGEYKNAEKHFRKAMTLLEKYPLEIERRGLYLLLSRSFRLQNKDWSKVLMMAQKAINLYPFRYEERKELGTTFCDLDEFDYGIEELENALSWKPDNPELLFDLGRYYLKRALICGDKKLRKKELKSAMENLNQSLTILKNYQVENRVLVRYWLGKVYSEINDPRKASPHFRILYNIRLGKEKDDIWMIAAMHLGNAYLKIKSYNESYELFDQIIKSFERYDGNVADDIVGERLDDHFTKREIFITACLGKSYTCIDRNGNLDEALCYAKLAGKYVNLTEPINYSKMSEEDRKFHKERILRCRASYENCRGWILYNLGLLDEAIGFLEMSVSRWADSLAYLHLALAYESKLGSLDPAAGDKTFLARKARECCRLALEFDIREEYAKELDDMKLRLGEKKVETSAIEGTKDGSHESIKSDQKCR